MKVILSTALAIGLCGLAGAQDEKTVLNGMAGEWVAESSVRKGQLPIPAETLAKLTLKIEKNQWIQSFDQDTATYTITLDPAKGTMVLLHSKNGTMLDTTYVLKGNKLTVTRVIDGEAMDTEVKVWRRKGQGG